jgi:hypothetical protein
MAQVRHVVLGAIVLSIAACSPEQSPTAATTQTSALDTTGVSAQVILATGPLPLPFPIPAPTGVNSAAMGLWTPSSFDNCTQAIHDAYRVVGPDGKWYPTWHPPIDPITGCRFGHEHGMNPSGSALYSLLGPLPFGVANEALDTYSPGFPRHEDHFGHKVAWANNVPVVDTFGRATSITCDVLVKLHQGTHSKDAFTNNLHELVYAAKCSDGVFAYATFLTAIGDPGQFIKACNHTVDVVEVVGPATPSNSPNGNGKRRIPDADCVHQGQVDEEWNTSSQIRGAPAPRMPDGALLAHFNPYFNVTLPSRAYDPTIVGLLLRPMDACYSGTIAAGSVAAVECRDATDHGTILGITFDDPRSPFNGATRRVAINRLVLPGSATMVWYTDPFGQNARTTPFPGSVRQVFRGTTSKLVASAYKMGKIMIDLATPGVHAPN